MSSPPKISFCLTNDEIETVEKAQKRLAKLELLRNRSEVIRCAISCLETMSDGVLKLAAENVQRMKPGRKPP